MTAKERRLELHKQADRTSSRFPPLLLAAERIASTVAQGVHGRRRVGQGDTFWQFRRYMTGDPASAVDWRQSAKSRHLFVRETEWEGAQSTWLWRDTSPSMQYSSNGNLMTKSFCADMLLLGLALLLMRAGERFALLGSEQRARSDRLAFERIANDMTRTEKVAENLPPNRPLPRNGQVILIGDFLSPPNEIAARIAALAAHGVTGLILHIVDPAERNLPFRGRVRFEGFENEGAMVLGQVQSARNAYQSNFLLHCEALHNVARRTGWVCQQHITDNSPASALLNLYTALAPQNSPG